MMHGGCSTKLACTRSRPGALKSERKQWLVKVDNEGARDLGRDDVGKRCGIARVEASNGILRECHSEISKAGLVGWLLGGRVALS